MRHSFVIAALSQIGSAIAAESCLATVTPCPSCPSASAIAPIKVLKQHQLVKTCTPVKVFESKSYYTIQPSCTTYPWVSTVIPCATGSATVTDYKQTVPICSERRTVTITFSSSSIAYGAKSSSTSSAKPSPIVQIYEKQCFAPYNELGPHAFAGYGGSGLCTTCGTAGGEEYQDVDIEECLIGGKCQNSAEKWTFAAPSPAAKATFATPGMYTLPAQTLTVPSPTVVAGISETVCHEGVNTIGGVSTSVAGPTTVTAVYPTIIDGETEMYTTTQYCPNEGPYTWGAITTTITGGDQTVEYPCPVSYEAGTYTRPALTTSVTDPGQVLPYPPYSPYKAPSGSASYSLPVYSEPSSYAAYSPGATYTPYSASQTYSSTYASSATSASASASASAAAGFVIAVGSGKAKRGVAKRASLGFISADGSVVPSSASAALFTIEDGQLRSGQFFVGIDSTSPFAKFVLSLTAPTISKTWTGSVGGAVAFSNPDFASGAASFCEDSSNDVVIVNSAKPGGCNDVSLTAQSPTSGSSSSASLGSSTSANADSSSSTSAESSGSASSASLVSSSASIPASSPSASTVAVPFPAIPGGPQVVPDPQAGSVAFTPKTDGTAAETTITSLPPAAVGVSLISVSGTMSVAVGANARRSKRFTGKRSIAGCTFTVLGNSISIFQVLLETLTAGVVTPFTTDGFVPGNAPTITLSVQCPAGETVDLTVAALALNVPNTPVSSSISITSSAQITSIPTTFTTFTTFTAPFGNSSAPAI